MNIAAHYMYLIDSTENGSVLFRLQNGDNKVTLDDIHTCYEAKGNAVYHTATVSRDAVACYVVCHTSVLLLKRIKMQFLHIHMYVVLGSLHESRRFCYETSLHLHCFPYHNCYRNSSAISL